MGVTAEILGWAAVLFVLVVFLTDRLICQWLERDGSALNPWGDPPRKDPSPKMPDNTPAVPVPPADPIESELASLLMIVLRRMNETKDVQGVAISVITAEGVREEPGPLTLVWAKDLETIDELEVGLDLLIVDLNEARTRINKAAQ